MSSLTQTTKRILNWLDTRNTGNITFKGKIQVNGIEIPINAKINVLNGGITSVNIQETIFPGNHKEK